jgi:short-subunit dehydrogenase involved in D-alanine esterification of teichoic acids
MILKNRTLLVTGASSGIGRALVDELAPVNRAIAVIARREQALQSLQATYPNVHPYPCDLACGESVAATIEKILKDMPALSGIINNAGEQVSEWLTDPGYRYDSLAREVAVNLTAPIQVCAASVRHLLARDEPAAYINISSGLGLFPKTGSAAYCATKAGLTNFTRGFGYQLKGSRVQCHNVILPLVDTPMTAGRGRGKLSPHSAARAIIAGVAKNQTDIYVGKARWLPLLARLSPSLTAAMMKSK